KKRQAKARCLLKIKIGKPTVKQVTPKTKQPQEIASRQEVNSSLEVSKIEDTLNISAVQEVKKPNGETPIQAHTEESLIHTKDTISCRINRERKKVTKRIERRCI
ncbi:hypothetical protein ACJMK2_023877, partial [Sinanodonta woodiana]